MTDETRPEPEPAPEPPAPDPGEISTDTILAPHSALRLGDPGPIDTQFHARSRLVELEPRGED